jgi:uncharacterized protein
LGAGFQILAKPNGSVCDLNCAYCFFLTKERLYPGGLFLMGDDLLKIYISQSFEASGERRPTFVWGGGEPAMIGADFFRRTLEYQRRCASDDRFINEFQTNGTHLDNAWCDFFHQNAVRVSISVDGPRPLHDFYRRSKEDQPTFDKVIRGVQLLQQNEIDYRIQCAVHAANVDYPLEVYRFFRDELGALEMRFIPIVERDNNTGFQEGDRVTSRSVDPVRYGHFLIAVFDEWLKHDSESVRVANFEAALANWVGMPPSECAFSPTCGDSPAVEHNGDLYCCEHFVEPGYFLGNIRETRMSELIASEHQAAFGHAKLGMLPRCCRECEVLFACHGE